MPVTVSVTPSTATLRDVRPAVADRELTVRGGQRHAGQHRQRRQPVGVAGDREEGHAQRRQHVGRVVIGHRAQHRHQQGDVAR
jgi:hypothetical protein